MKVRAGITYIYYPNLMDRCDARTKLIPGDMVKVVNLHGCPPANTMGQAYVNLDGKFAGMVSTNSLYPLTDAMIVVDAIKADMEKLREVR